MNSRLGMICHFSVYTNALRIVNTKTTPDTLPAIQGIRFFTMLWIVFGHEFFMDLIGPTVNLLDLADVCFSTFTILLYLQFTQIYNFLFYAKFSKCSMIQTSFSSGASNGMQYL